MSESRETSKETPLDIGEKGKNAEGEVTSLNRRLFFQFHAFGDCTDTAPLVTALEESGVVGVLYEDVQDPRGVGFMTFAEDPAYFLNSVRPVLSQEPFLSLTQKHEYSMMGRTYSIGYERDLEETLLKRPLRHCCNPEWPWAVWYPLRRSGEFEQMSWEEQRVILMEHGGIGRAYGRNDYAHDVRLACQGLDKNDNDFVTGLMGKELYPLSKVVQRMRKTKQTAHYLTKLGPFFVGHAIWMKKDGHS